MLFHLIRYKNFLSSGNQFVELVLDSHQTTLLIGKNGAGKSTVNEAIAFALFGVPFRKINKGQLINSISGKNCLVEIEFTNYGKRYLVRRGIKPNLFEIYVDGQLLPQPAKVDDYQAILEKQILRTNFKTFCQVVMLGSAVFVPFMKMTTTDRRKVVEDILDLQVFSKMNLILKDDVKKLTTQITELSAAIDLDKQKIELHRIHQEKLKKNNNELIQARMDSISEYHNTNKGIDVQIKNLQDKRQELIEDDNDQFEKLNQKKKEINTLIIKLEQQISIDNTNLKFFKQNNTCPTCTQDISDQFSEAKILELVSLNSEKQIAITKLNNKNETIEQKINAIKAVLSAIDKIDREIANKQQQIANNNSMIVRLQKEIKQLQTPQTNDDVDIKFLENTLNNNTVQYNELSHDKRVCSYTLMLLQDNGIKAKIIEQYIPTINNLINRYLAALDFLADFNLDENFNETIRSRYRDEFTYHSFSEGQKARIDLALLLTWREIARMRSSLDSNILILDEVFDGSLDDEGVENLSKILDMFKDKLNLVVISHKGGYEEKFNRTIRFKLVNNFSTMEEVI